MDRRIRRPLAALFVAALFVGALAAAPAPAADRIALVIGNQAYAAAPPAVAAARDARAIARALEAAGYAVALGIDLDRAAMRDALEAFGAAAPAAERAVVYYSGHALRTGARSYLAPVDAEGGSLASVLFDGVPLELVLRLAAEAREGAVVFVDAAQLAGFAPQPFAEPGLADIAATPGVLVVSAAAPGRAIARSAGLDSRFARRVIEQFLLPDQPAMQAVREAGGDLWAVGGLGPRFAIVEAPPPVTGDRAGLGREIEIAFWEAAERSGAAEDYEAYLARFPAGNFADLARNRLRQIEAARRDPNEATEAALGLDRDARRRIQRDLTALGHATRGIDGVFGPATRGAIRDFQSRNGFPPTGFLTGLQLDALAGLAARAEADRRAREAEEARAAAAADEAFWRRTGAEGTAEGYRAYLARYPEGARAAEAEQGLERLAGKDRDEAGRRERRFWEEVARADRAEGYRDYLARHPQGLYASRAARALDRIERAERAAAEERRLARIESALGLEGPDRIAVEQRLRHLGYPVGRPDGVFDRDTRRAITLFQEANGLPSTGYLDRKALVVLVRQSGGRRPIEGRIDAGRALHELFRALEGG